jgi:methionyl-tRNA formyltransferase
VRLVFMGYQTWGHRVLDALLAEGHEIPLVITHPTSDHAYEIIWNDSVAALAAKHDIPLLERRHANGEDIAELLRELDPDLLVSSDWRTWVAPRIYGLAKHGAINIHDALLPRYGGFAPLNWALVNGEREVGVTVHFMNERFDLGDIVLQRRVPVEDDDTVTDLFDKTIELFAPMVLEAIDLIDSGRTDWTAQDPAEATFFHKRSVEDSRISWTTSARDIVNLVRAQVDPYPNAFAHLGAERVRVLSASVSTQRLGGTPGRLFRPEGDGGVAVVCGPDARAGSEFGVVLERVRTDDDREHRAADYFRTMGGYLTSHPHA